MRSGLYEEVIAKIEVFSLKIALKQKIAVRFMHDNGTTTADNGTTTIKQWHDYKIGQFLWGVVLVQYNSRSIS